jgi:hypothetical protein
MRALPLAYLLLVAGGCEVVTGFDDLEFQPEPCVPDPMEEVCANVACGTTQDNCGNDVICPDTCEVPYACGVGGVTPNQCGCTGGEGFQTPVAPPECPVAETREGRTYYFCDPLMEWEDARAFCQGFGTDLAVIDDQAENDFVTLRMRGKSWLGLYVPNPDGCDPVLGCEFHWVNGVVLDATRYANWNMDTGEPNNTGGSEFCVEILNDLSVSGRWNDAPCSSRLNIVCETTCP